MLNVRKIVVLLPFSLFTFVLITNAQQYLFSRTLKFGMTGEDVRQLQIILNRDQDTIVAKTGIGSPGQESSYFGTLTQKAVIRFQEKNKDFILKPNGLSYGTGIVGPSTRDFLSKMNSNPQSVANSTTIPITKSPSSTQNLTTNNKVVGSGPNYANIGIFLNKVEEVAKKKGFSSDKIALVKEQIYKGVSTTTDLKSQFMNKVKEKNLQVRNDQSVKKSLFTGLFGRVANKAKDIIVPKEVFAAAGTPFGGALLFAFFCNCSDTWLITLEPLPPTGVVLLDYLEGSQAFLYNNIPFTNWLLGEYIPGASTCFTGNMCVEVAAEGLISPIVGSSP